MKTGKTLTLASRGDPLKNPDTEAVIGYTENIIGKIKVVQVKQKYSVAKLTKKNKELEQDIKPKKGDYVLHIDK